MRFYTRHKRPPSIVIVSLIDILAILLIFFIVTTTFKKEQPQVVIELPESKSAAPVSTSEVPAIVYITKANEIFFETRPVSVEQLEQVVTSLRSENPGRGVAMQADREASFGTIIGVLDVLKAAGFKNLPAFTDPGS